MCVCVCVFVCVCVCVCVCVGVCVGVGVCVSKIKDGLYIIRPVKNTFVIGRIPETITNHKHVVSVSFCIAKPSEYTTSDIIQ